MEKWKKILGFALLALAILLIEFTPDPLSLGLYAVTHGIEFSSINANNIGMHLWDFEVWSISVGFLLLLGAMYLLGWNFKKVWKKLNLDKYWLAFVLAIAVVIAVAYLDIQGMLYWASFSTTSAYVNGLQGAAFWGFFKSIVLVLFAILPIAYFFLYRRDVSETIALFLSEIILWMFGFADLMFFVLQKQLVPNILPWLNNHPIIGGISSSLGYSNVNPVSLLFTVMVGFILAYFSAKILKDKF